MFITWRLEEEEKKTMSYRSTSNNIETALKLT